MALRSRCRAAAPGHHRRHPRHDRPGHGWIDEATIRHALDLLKAAKEIETAKPVAEYYTNARLEGAGM